MWISVATYIYTYNIIMTIYCISLIHYTTIALLTMLQIPTSCMVYFLTCVIINMNHVNMYEENVSVETHCCIKREMKQLPSHKHVLALQSNIMGRMLCGSVLSAVSSPAPQSPLCPVLSGGWTISAPFHRCDALLSASG